MRLRREIEKGEVMQERARVASGDTRGEQFAKSRPKLEKK